jgi:L-amino acid N-acyltransferase YncA
LRVARSYEGWTVTLTEEMKPAVRLATAQDAAAIASIYRPFVESTIVSFELDPPGEREMGERINTTLPRYPWLVCEMDRQIAGYAYATAHRTRLAYQWSVDTAVYLRPEWHRRGIGRRLYRSLIQLLIAQGYCNAYAGITLPNAASVGLHEAVGFRPLTVYHQVGYKLGAWHDVGWWQLQLAPHAANPERPRTLDELTFDLSTV